MYYIKEEIFWSPPKYQWYKEGNLFEIFQRIQFSKHTKGRMSTEPSQYKNHLNTVLKGDDFMVTAFSHGHICGFCAASDFIILSFASTRIGAKMAAIFRSASAKLFRRQQEAKQPPVFLNLVPQGVFPQGSHYTISKIFLIKKITSIITASRSYPHVMAQLYQTAW